MRRGITLPELIVGLSMMGALSLLLLPRVGTWLDRLAAERAAAETATFYTRARFAAIFSSERVRVEFATDTLRAVREGRETAPLFAQPGPARHGVDLRASRRTIRIGPTGLGWGAANTRLVLTRGAAAETLTTSRLGRLKRWK